MFKKYVVSALLVTSLFLASPRANAQQKAVDAEGHQWWQHAVFYEIYPRSFADSNNDGVGDLRGITAKLDYLKDLGVDAIWLTPCFLSPQVDFGYDVSDYENIDPMYGTLQDFDRLEKEGERRDIHIIMDFVMNHSSDQHKWFLDSKSSRDSAHRDWYIWRDGKAPGQPPNNWISLFGGPAWKFDPTTGQYYYHYFYSGQPDLNWRNPAVKKAMFDVTRFWYKRGVAGFRLDAVDTLFEDPQLHDNPMLPGLNKYGDPNTQDKYNTKFPEVHDVLRELRQVADEHGAVLTGETWTGNIDELKKYYGEHSNELQMPMDLMFATVNKLSPSEFRLQIAAVDSAGGWPRVRHQQPRHRPFLRSLRGRPAQRCHRQVNGGALPYPAGNSHHVLRRRNWNGEQHSQEQGRGEGPYR
jgi:alpha-glucosidase